ncbi:unnamed protein product [Didymodactylos carnosus]|uniref:Tetratricopeptide repeat protein n=1 Tax=Didymodactylos carnosus TaxID=1234261 RepID=A0A813ZYN9_9BILA|nr:unnamed protein product [Didymodactylos carnosus]CAF0904952.1 unnamed protein product [Didymodactylos carnosus]CAF3569061.1 unnamed protein product [Didymodactylos carnosus]CAF3686824.1 unnamed protein product [Didymodactylos carnosus]
MYVARPQGVKSYKDALDHQIRLQFSNNNKLALIYNNIGYVYLQQEHFEESLGTIYIYIVIENLNEAEHLLLRELKSNRQHLRSIYCNVRQVYYEQQNYDTAVKFYDRNIVLKLHMML